MEKLEDVYKYIKFPPLYTEQINNITLSKQLEIWQRIVENSLKTKSLKFTLNGNDKDIIPFKNDDVNRRVNTPFLTLILQYLIEKDGAFYIHPIESYCSKKTCTVWSCLFNNKKYKANHLYHLNLEYRSSLLPTSTSTGLEVDIESLKKRRDSLMESQYKIGLLPSSVDKMCDLTLNCIKSQCTTKDVETVYFLFYDKKSVNEEFNFFPEVHLAFILSTLSHLNKVELSYNETVHINNLTNKHVGIQLL